jgi:hypothetical protein
MSNELDLTYGAIAAELVEALERREEAAQELVDARVYSLEAGDSQRADEAMEAFESAQLVLQEYLKAEVKKADSIAGYIRRTEALASIREEEAERLDALAAADRQRVAWLKQSTIAIMREMDLKKCEGAAGFLRRQGNGGVQPVEVRQPELLPLRFQRFTLTITGTELKQLRSFDDPTAERVTERAKPAEPDITAIRESLLAGEAVPGCVLQPRGETLRTK